MLGIRTRNFKEHLLKPRIEIQIIEKKFPKPLSGISIFLNIHILHHDKQTYGQSKLYTKYGES